MISILNKDIYKIIISISSVSIMKSLSLVDKTFNNICRDNDIWIKIFQNNDLEFLDSDINNLRGYVNEYNSVSYATHIRDSLFVMDGFIFLKSNEIVINNVDISRINRQQIIPVILSRNMNITTLYINFGFNKKTYDHWLKLSYNNTSYVTLYHEPITLENVYYMLLKLLYYYPDINIIDWESCPLIMDKSRKFCNNKYYKDFYDNDYTNKDIFIERKEYWKKCDKLYYETYF
jgi:hypothetical protein